MTFVDVVVCRGASICLILFIVTN